MIGLTCAAFLHAGLFLSSHWMVKPAPFTTVRVDKDPSVQITPPPPEQEKEDPVTALKDEPPVVNQRAIPSLTDIVAEVPVNAFTEPMQPPPPPGLPTDPNAITIPVTHTYNQLPGDGPIFKPSDLDQPPVLRAPV
ncbi:MAG: hypothetical protein ACHQ5A_12435, partial [Opitutales bacterium]